MPRTFAGGRAAGHADSAATSSEQCDAKGPGSLICLGVGGLAVAHGKGSALRTLALGSCVALILSNSELRFVGMVHVALPSSTINPARAAELPGLFADTGAEALMRAMARTVGAASPGCLTACLVGGANVLQAGKLFNIGEKNVIALRGELAQRRFTSVLEDVGGAISRTVQIDAVTGIVQISSPGRGIWEVCP